MIYSITICFDAMKKIDQVNKQNLIANCINKKQ